MTEIVNVHDILNHARLENAANSNRVRAVFMKPGNAKICNQSVVCAKRQSNFIFGKASELWNYR